MTGIPPDLHEGTVGVLICDDSEPMRDVLRDVINLRSTLRVVGIATDGNEAIAEAVRLQPDVILLDLAMPNRTGLSALPELRRVAPAAQIVVFSSLPASTVAAEVIGLGAVRYLEKGASADTINDAIEEAASGAQTSAPPGNPQPARPPYGAAPRLIER